jgi:hypothetical protein
MDRVQIPVNSCDLLFARKPAMSHIPDIILTPDAVGLARLLAHSFRRFTGKDIVPDAAKREDKNLAQALYMADVAIVAHGAEADPVFCYGNACALGLWEMDWQDFTQLPSRLSAQADTSIQADRDALLRKALQNGWVDDYTGVRISRTGRRFRISDTLLWNLTDEQGRRHGQAAYIRNWHYL